jgi:uroporphyrinogen III methyltransferase/synthase
VRAVTVYLVGAGPGDPGLLTRRGAALVARADVVVHDRLVDPAVLSLARPDAVLVDVGKRPDDPAGGAARQEEINDLLVRRGRTGLTVVRLKGGDPYLFGRGGEEAEALTAAGVPWEVVPGVTSAFAVPASVGVPVTHRGVSTSVTVVTGRVGDSAGPVDWESLSRAGGTLVVLMGVATRAEIARRLTEAGKPADTPVVVVERGTTPLQRTVRTTLAGLPDVPLDAPSVVVVGPAAGLRIESGRPPLAGITVVVTRARAQSGPLADELVAAGARVVEVPVVETAEPDDGGEQLRRAAGGVARFGWVAFTSANAVDRFVACLRDARDLAGVGLAAVGPATVAALARHGLVADLVPDDPTAAGLARAMTGPPARVLFPCAAAARPDLPEALAARGWEVERVVAYRTVPAPPPPEAVTGALAGADAVTFTSPSAVEAYLAMTDRDGRPLPLPPLVACIGPTTAAAARAAGLAVAVESPLPTSEALVAALAAAVAGGGEP